MKGFKCKECDRDARWIVWYEGFSALYIYLCTKHAIRAMRKTKDYSIVCVRSIKDAIEKKDIDLVNWVNA